MAKRSKILPARKPEDAQSMLVRSAESLGRIIGSLQRELDLAITRDERQRRARPPASSNGHDRARAGETRRESSGAKGRPVVSRTKRAAKPSAATRSAAGSGARRAPGKRSRGN